MDKLSEAIREAFKRSVEEDDSAVNLSESIESWEYATIEDFLADQYDESDALYEGLRGDQKREFELGDIIFTNKYYSPSSRSVVKGSAHSPGTGGHKIIVITSKKDDDGVVYYRGFALTSNVDNSNYHNGYKNKLYINNYSTILSRGARDQRPAAVNVNELIKCNSKDLSPTGTFKGHVSDEFLEFLNTGYSNYKSGKDNSRLYWEKNKDENNSRDIII